MDAPPVCLQLFGTPTVQRGTAVLALPFERRGQLVALLALRRGWVPRAEVAALLWPEQPGKLAFTNLRKTLFRLQALPGLPAIESQGAALRLQVPTDVDDFETALQQQRIADALAAYRGELLAGFDDDGPGEAWAQWLTFERGRLRAAWRSAALTGLGSGMPAADAIALSARLLDADPLDEAALREHMAALARDGQAAAARAAWRLFAERLAQDLGLEPGAELRALHDALGGTLPAAAPAPAAANAAADDGFVGRSIELRRIADLLARPECRLLCLIGPGGMGKTRLARRAMQALAPSFADGARFVGLEDVETPQQFGLRLAQEAGAARPRGADDALARAIDAWRGSELLLVLDNFEPLAEHAPLLERLLLGCPRLRLVVTSRVRLTVADEWSMPIEGLPCPDPEDDDRAESFDAVRLFVNAAMRVDPGFAAAAERAAVVDICRQVEGLPLALELAAAWVRVLPCQAIADELRHGTELLRARDASHPARHASIEVVFEHSWQRLGEAERAVLARLSVFHGGFSVEAARAVAGASLPVLGALADKSLLVKAGARMRLHPLMQQLAAARLDERGAQAATEAAHADWFHRWLERLQRGVEQGDRGALQAVDDDHENCRRAWVVSLRDGQVDGPLRSARTLLTHADYRGHVDGWLAQLRDALASPPGRNDAGLRALLLAQAAHMAYRVNRYDDALADADAALAAARPRRDVEARRQALRVLGSCALHQGRLADARRFYKQSLALAAELAPDSNAATLDNLALVERRMGHYDEALRLSLDALALYRRSSDRAGLALCLTNVANHYLFREEYEQAQPHAREALALCDQLGLAGTRAFALSALTELAMRTGDLAAAETYTTRALDTARANGNRAVVCSMLLQQARLATRRGDLVAARTALAGGADVAIAIGTPLMQASTLQGLAELFEAQHERACARRVLAFAIDLPGISPSDRDELRADWARLAEPLRPDPPWPPGLAVDELLRRVGGEAAGGHAALIAALRAPD